MNEAITLNQTEQQWQKENYYEIHYEFSHFWHHLPSAFLPVDIGLDIDHSYQDFKHPLWLHFNNGYNVDKPNWVPLIINNEPEDCYVPLDDFMLEITLTDFQALKKFAANYHDMLALLANREIDLVYFCQVVYSANELFESSEFFNKPKPLFEMARLDKHEAGLPRDLFIDDDQTNIAGKHGPRVKFQPANGERDKFKWPSISFTPEMNIDTPLDKLTVYGTPQQLRGTSTAVINKIKKWILLNVQLLWDTANKKCTFKQFKENFKKIDKNGIVIDNLPYNTYLHCENGYMIVKHNSGLFNLLTANKKFLSKQWFKFISKMKNDGQYNYWWFEDINGRNGNIFDDGEIIYMPTRK